MLVATTRVPTLNGLKYARQLCKHWAHKLPVEERADGGTVRFPAAVATMTAPGGALHVRIEAENAATLEAMKQVVAAHLDRFAFREAPLPFLWSAAP